MLYCNIYSVYIIRTDFTLSTQVVVGMVLCVISLLTVYMAFLHLLDPWLTKKRQTAYKQHAEEEVGSYLLSSPPLPFFLRKVHFLCFAYRSQRGQASQWFDISFVLVLMHQCLRCQCSSGLGCIVWEMFAMFQMMLQEP